MIRLIFASITSIFLIMACSDDDNNLGSASMSATINGNAWQTITRATVQQGEKFIITGTSINGEILAITIFGQTEDTYELNLTSVKCAALYKESASVSAEDAYAAVNGKVIVTDINTSDKRISGTFEFSLMKQLSTSPMTITNGKFENLLYTIQE